MSEGQASQKHIYVVGAGIVGVCAALSLLRDGHAVTLVDRQGPGEGASFGNGAVITPDSIVPVATPGILRQVPGMLLDPLGPLRIRWSYLPRLLPWLMPFLTASRPSRVEAIARSLSILMEDAVEAYRPLTEMAGAADMIKRSGWICVYESEKEFRAGAERHALQKRCGVKLEALNGEELQQLEPALGKSFQRGVFYPDAAHTVNNFRLVQVLAEALTRNGGRILQAEVRGFETGEQGVRALRTDLGRHACDGVVIAAGAWSKRLCAELGSSPPLDTERGYHLTVTEPGVAPRIPLYSTRRGIVCTPQEHGLRIAGTVELGGLEAPPDWRRAEVLMTRAKSMLPGLQEKGVTRWMGYRPSMPDSVPVISASPHHANAFFAFGHGHIGLSLGARSGALVADLAAGRDPGIDMRPYRIDRF